MSLLTSNFKHAPASIVIGSLAYPWRSEAEHHSNYVQSLIFWFIVLPQIIHICIVDC